MAFTLASCTSLRRDGCPRGTPLCMLAQIEPMPQHQSTRHHDNIHGKNLTTGYSSLAGYIAILDYHMSEHDAASYALRLSVRGNSSHFYTARISVLLEEGIQPHLSTRVVWEIRQFWCGWQFLGVDGKSWHCGINTGPSPTSREGNSVKHTHKRHKYIHCIFHANIVLSICSDYSL